MDKQVRYTKSFDPQQQEEFAVLSTGSRDIVPPLLFVCGLLI